MLNTKTVGKRIHLLRKNKQYTQEALGSLLNITPQAISKQEQGHALPDTVILSALSKILGCSIDFLLLGAANSSPYDDVYSNTEYYWGVEPSRLSEQLVELRSDNQSTSILDIGSGEGRDAIYFATKGLIVDALEISAPGIDKIQKHASANNCTINTIHANMIDYQLEKIYDVIYSCGSMQFMPLAKRQESFEKYKQYTAPNGLNAHLVFVNKPFIKVAPDWQANEYFYYSGELATYYADWEILSYDEQIISCKSMGIKHQHAICSIIAKKIILQRGIYGLG